MNVWFRRAQNCLLGYVCRLGWSANILSCHVQVMSASLCPKSRAQVPSILPSTSTHGLFTSGYTAVLRITRNFLIINSKFILSSWVNIGFCGFEFCGVLIFNISCFSLGKGLLLFSVLILNSDRGLSFIFFLIYMTAYFLYLKFRKPTFL